MLYFRKIKRFWHNLTHPVIGEVWEFHRVTDSRSDDPRYAPYDVTPHRLESIIQEYLRKGFRFISIDEVCEIVQKNNAHALPRQSKFICVTLDDGYMDNYENAYPIFRKYNIPFCIYVTTGYLDGKFLAREDCPLSMTTVQIQELAKEPLCTLGAHTVSHPYMPNLSEEVQRKEIEDSISILENIINTPAYVLANRPYRIQHYTIPFGRFDYQTVTSLLKSANVRSNVYGWGGAIRKEEGCHLYFIPRIIIEETKKTF